MSELISLESAASIVNRVAKRLYNVGDMQCLMCHGKGFILYGDDDAFDIAACDCTFPIEVKR